MKSLKLSMALMLLFNSAVVMAQTKIIAHRGNWKCDGSAQNSITSLARAAEAKVFGSEFDVQLTRDNVAVVNHDNTIQGKVIGETPFAELKDLKLANGETLPTLEQYLQKGKTLKGLQLVLEIKPHATQEKEDEAVNRIVAMVGDMKLQKRVDYISFSRHICERLAQLTPSSSIAYLGGDIAPAELKRQGINGIDYNHKALAAHPEWIGEAHGLGMTVNVWTVSTPELMQEMVDMGVDFITTDTPTEKIRLRQQEVLNLVFIGNSITFGATLPDHKTQAPPVLVGRMLREEGRTVRVGNCGVSGATTLDWLPGRPYYNKAQDKARELDKRGGRMVFSIMLGTNDSAEKGPSGSPVNPADYKQNMQTIIDSLMAAFPAAAFVLNYPIWYSPSTYNGAIYLQPGLDRLQTYHPIIDQLVREYQKRKCAVYGGSKETFGFFENNLPLFTTENGHQGKFYLHPNPEGAEKLAGFWTESIRKVANSKKKKK